MPKRKSLIMNIRANITEIWLGVLLFGAIPLAVGLYTDYRGFLATTFLSQSIVLILYYRKSN